MDNKEELKKVIRLFANQEDFKSQLKSLARSSLVSRNALSVKDQLVDIIRKNDLVEDILSELNLRDQNDSTTRPKQDTVDRQVALGAQTAHRIVKPDDTAKRNRRYLNFNVTSGRAFVDYIRPPGSLDEAHPKSSLTVHLRFGHQRFQSESLPCCCEPQFNHLFMIDLDDVGSDINQLFSITHMINIVIVRTCRDKVTLVSTCELDWRDVLSEKDKLAVPLELRGIGPESRTSVGILDVTLSLLPPLDRTLNRETVSTNRKLEQHRLAERRRTFMNYAKQWWVEYLDIRLSHSERLVKILAQDTLGEHRFVCSFVVRVAMGRMLGGACEALRFVSLIPQDGDALPPVGGTSTQPDIWCDVATFLTTGKGNYVSHSLLLCCLLRECGLTAFVCFGSRAESRTEPCSWVMTVGHSGDVTFWDAVSGTRYASVQKRSRCDRSSEIAQYPYQTIDCIFNASSFYANCQFSNLIASCDFDLSDGTRWKAMSPEGIRSLEGDRTPTLALELLPATPNPLSACLAMESELRAILAQHREDMGLSTRWNAELGVILGQCLTNYELQKLTGKSIANDDFYDAIQNVIPSGHTFKGFPIHMKHQNCHKIFTEGLKSEIFKDIVSARGDEINFALHVKIYAFPENVVSCWTMVAVSFCEI